MGPKYNLKVAKLAWDISQQLKTLATTAASEPAKAAPRSRKPVIYLAECSWDQRQAREALEADLRLHGYSILPDRQLPRDEAAYVAEVARLLEQSDALDSFRGDELRGSAGRPHSDVGRRPPERAGDCTQQKRGPSAGDLASGRNPVLAILRISDSSRRSSQTPTRNGGRISMTSDLETLKGAIHAALEKLRDFRPSTVSAGDRPCDGQPRVHHL